MKRTARGTALLIASCFAALGVASAAPDFTGNWKMNVAKSEFGPIPAPEILTRTIQHHDPSLEYKTYQKGAQGEVTTEIKYSTDGKPSVNKVQDSDSKGSAHWQGTTLIIESSRDFQGMQIGSKETWTLSDGGKTLTINNHVTIPGQGEFDLKLVLDKQ
jgi:hypothetical protein